MDYCPRDEERIKTIGPDPRFPAEKYRTPWRQDYARLIHSASFRRLQGKSQLFPEHETDFFRNRLTHSLEVAQIAKSIAIKLNSDVEENGESYRIEPDIVELGALAHDLGHPPFGHFGEEVLDEKMIDSGGFEGNAQTLRLLARLEKKHLVENTDFGIDGNGKDKRVGLNLTCRTIASILKYDQVIPSNRKKREELLKKKELEKISPIKGCYETEQQIVQWAKDNICQGKKYNGSFKTVECQIMDIADDIAYSTYDLEDCLKAGFTNPLEILSADNEIGKRVAGKVSKNLKMNFSREDFQETILKIFHDYFEPPYDLDQLAEASKEQVESLHFFSLRFANFMSKQLQENGDFRTDFTSKQVGRAVRSVRIDKIDHRIPALSTVKLDRETAIYVEVLKHMVYESQILSPKVQMVAYRSKDIIGTILAHYQVNRKKATHSYRRTSEEFTKQ